MNELKKKNTKLDEDYKALEKSYADLEKKEYGDKAPETKKGGFFSMFKSEDKQKIEREIEEKDEKIRALEAALDKS